MRIFSSKFKVIYFNTFQKEFRNKSLIFLFVLTTLVIFILHTLFGSLTELLEGSPLPQDGVLAKLPLNVFYLFIDSWSLLVAAVIGVSVVQSDQESNVISQLLSFSVKRWEYLLARVLAGWSIVILYYFYSLGLVEILFYSSSKEFLASGQVLFAMINSCFILLPAILFAIFYSLYAPKIIAFVLTFFSTFVISWANYSMADKSFSQVFENLDFKIVFYSFLHYLFPRVGTLNQFTNEILQGKDFELSFYGLTFVHYIGSSLLVFLALSFLFKRKKF